MKKSNNETHEKILHIAETLFLKHGYVAVRLKDISDAIGIERAALYYYAPDGKEQLFMQVMERNLARHRTQTEVAIQSAGPTLREKMRAVAGWLFSQPPVNIARLEATDFRAIKPENAQKLTLMIYEALRQPLMATLEDAQREGTVHLPDINLALITFMALIESIHPASSPEIIDADTIIDALIDMLLNGWLAR